MFKILYVHTLHHPEFEEDAFEDIRRKEARYQSVMRILRPTEMYKFMDNKLSDSFFNTNTPCVSVSAIVGENGQGKSSLMELMLRIINNMAYALRPAYARANRSHPRFVRGVYAELGFEYDGKECKVSVNDLVVEFFRNGEGVWKYDYSQKKNENRGLEYLNMNCQDARDNIPPVNKAHDWISDLFYTIVVNYSAYSYNTDDYFSEYIDDIDLDDDELAEGVTDEEKCWLCGIFHKNDGYQMPIVLNPFRSEGQIDYNNETDLLQTRIFLLAMAKNSPLSTIYKDKKPKSFVFDIVTDYSPTGAHLFTSVKSKIEMYYLRYIDDWRHADGARVDMLGNRIIGIWSKCVGVDLLKCSKEVVNDDKRRTLNYIVYKTIKIALNYEKYKRYQESLKDVDAKLTGTSEIEQYIKLLYSDNTHITLKLMRAIAWLVFGHYSTSMKKEKKCEKRTTNSEIAIEKFAKRIDLRLKNVKNYTEKGHGKPIVERYADLPLHHWTKEDLLPVPSFRADLRFELLDADSKTTGKSITLRSFSSGEKHIAGSLFTALYHINNLHSLWGDSNNGDGIKYHNINLVFDEIELYFHPKYQTMFLKMLIDSINAMNIGDRIEGINILISTHSPFVLSDIPCQNILCMESGMPKPWSGDCNTFCANVYDILSSGFFMDKFVGDFAEAKYHELIDIMEDCCNRDMTEDEITAIESEISLIGDDYLRNSLMEAFCAAAGRYKMLIEEKEKLSQRIKAIEEQLNPNSQR